MKAEMNWRGALIVNAENATECGALTMALMQGGTFLPYLITTGENAAIEFRWCPAAEAIGQLEKMLEYIRQAELQRNPDAKVTEIVGGAS